MRHAITVFQSCLSVSSTALDGAPVIPLENVYARSDMREMLVSDRFECVTTVVVAMVSAGQAVTSASAAMDSVVSIALLDHIMERIA